MVTPSIKVFMTYDKIKLDDEQMLDVLAAARDNGAFVCVHAENHGMISFMSKRLLANRLTGPSAFWMSHPRLAEVDAIQRLVAMSQLVDQPIMVFHVSTTEGIDVVRKARADGVKLFAETCPHYLLLTTFRRRQQQARARRREMVMCSPSLVDGGGSGRALAGPGAWRPAGDLVRIMRRTGSSVQAAS